MSQTFRSRLGALTLGLALPLLAQTPPPPEAAEMRAATALQDPAARIKELQRLKAAYPTSSYQPFFDAYIQAAESQMAAAKVAKAATLAEALALQEGLLASAQGPARLRWLVEFGGQLLNHPKAAGFDKTQVLSVLQSYRDQGQKGLAELLKASAGLEQAQEMARTFAAELQVNVAQAQVRVGQPAQALTSLEAYRKEGGEAKASYFLAKAEAHTVLKQAAEAYEAYLGAALDGHRQGLVRAKEAFLALKKGDEKAFEAELEARSRVLPFHPEPFKPTAAWKGKTVLVELFTGSECPPCVGADLALDGLMEAFPSTALVVLEYHLPIPQPDPMMNPTTQKRQDLYAVNSTPTIWMEGQERVSGGGPRSSAEGLYKHLRAKVAGRLNGAPGATLKVKATRAGDRVSASLDLGAPLPNVDYHLVLVQGHQEHKGGNRLMVHRMVVRELVTLEAGARVHTFDLAASEQATEAYLTNFEKTSPRFRNFTFPQRRSAIDRKDLKVALLAQERGTKRVLQTVLADIQ